MRNNLCSLNPPPLLPQVAILNDPTWFASKRGVSGSVTIIIYKYEFEVKVNSRSPQNLLVADSTVAF